MQLVNEYEAAKILRRGVQTLRNQRAAGTGAPYVKLGKSVRYDLEDLRRYIEAHRIKTEEAA
jgi:2-hydroxychromene-2-carboxylate isomerase